MFLLAIALGLIGGFAREVSSVLRASAGKDRTLEGARLALDRIADDLAGALTVSTPSSGSSFSLVFLKVDSDAVGRLPMPLPTPAPNVWDPVDPGFLAQVTYTVQDDFLVRQTLYDNGAEEAEALVERLNSLTTVKLTDSSYQLTISNWEGRKVSTVTTRASVRLR